MERYVGQLITMIRQHVGQLSSSVDSSGAPTKGLTDDLILEYLNDAQDFIQSRIIETYPKAFLTTDTDTVVANQETYSINDNIFFNKIKLVEFSPNGLDDNYYPLDQISLRERNLQTGSEPTQYAIRGVNILPSPIPGGSTGKFRYTYYRALDNLALRAGQIEDTVDDPETELGLYTTGGSAAPTDYLLSSAQHICIVDSLGVVKDYNVLVSSYDEPNDNITIPSQTLNGAAGDFITVGKYTTTHSDLPEQAERFLKTYAQMRIFQKLGSSKAREEGFEMSRMIDDVVDSYKEENHDMQFIPIVDYGLFD